MSKRQLRAQREMQEMQREDQEHQMAQRAAFDDGGRVSQQFIESLTSTSLDAATISHLQNLLSKDFVLGKLNSAEKDELKWLMRNIWLRVKRMHPPEESYVKGEFRKVLHDDPKDGLRPLSDRQEEEIWHVILGVFARVSRSHDGWQQEEFGKVYAVTERRESGDEGRLDGLFPGGK